MKKIVVILIAVMMLMGLMVGCGTQAEKAMEQTAAEQEKTVQEEKPAAEAASEEKKEEPVFPLTVKDANDFEMTLEKQPEGIVSLTLGTDEMLLGMIDKGRIKSMTVYVDDPDISNAAEAAKGVGERLGSEAEKIIALQPDLVLVDTWAKAEFVQQLRDAKITVYVFKTPSNVEDQKKTVLEIAHVVGADAKGQELVAWMDSKLMEVEEKLKALKPEEKLTVLDYSEMGYASAKGTNFDDIVTRAGLVNASAQAGMESWVQISKEKIVELDPDVLILPSWFYDKKNTADSFTQSIKDDKSLTDVKAVKNNRIVILPNPHMSAISQYVVLGVEDTAKAAYPELFK
jgi:iron complex transport system substrate-binding protein